MNPKIVCLLIATILTLNVSVFAAAGKTYQITGTIVAATGTEPHETSPILDRAPGRCYSAVRGGAERLHVGRERHVRRSDTNDEHVRVLERDA